MSVNTARGFGANPFRAPDAKFLPHFMPQEFHVLDCCSCHTFQVQQVTKQSRWTCKVCNQKQSVRKVYMRGVASACRSWSQSLNLSRGVDDLGKQDAILRAIQDGTPHELGTTEESTQGGSSPCPVASKWLQYLETPPETVLPSEATENSLRGGLCNPGPPEDKYTAVSSRGIADKGEPGDALLWGTPNSAKQIRGVWSSSHHKGRTGKSGFGVDRNRADTRSNEGTDSRVMASKWNQYL